MPDEPRAEQPRSDGPTQRARTPREIKRQADRLDAGVTARHPLDEYPLPSQLRRALGGALLTVGALMAVGGIAGAGNTAGDSATAAPTTAAAATAPASAPTTAAAANLPPVVGPIVAVLNPPNTSYTVQASDPEGKTLTYTWTKTNTCGSFTSQNNVAVWGHPHPPCGDEVFHPGTVTVSVSDGANVVQRVYTQGSLGGTGTVPASPSVLPTTTSRPSTPTATPTATSGSATGGGGPNLPLTGAGLLLAGAGGAVLLRTREKASRNCDRERAEEARTRGELERAKEAFDDIAQARSARDHARDEAARAQRAWQQAQRGAALGEDPVTHEPLFGSGAKSQAAKAAYEAARDAQDRAEWRERDYDAKGGDAAWQRAKDAHDAAKAAHDAAADALARCEQSLRPPEPTDGGTTTGGGAAGGTTGGGTPAGGTATGGPMVSTGGDQRTQERRCRQGDRRNEHSTSREVKFAEINRAEVCLDSNYPYAVDPLYVEQFMDWLGTVRDLFKAGKTIRSFVEGELVEGGLDLADFPDFYTYFDKMTDEVRRSMDRLVGTMREKARTGDYYLRYSRQVYTLTCTTWEECDGAGRWTARRSVKAERTGTERHRETNKLQVDDRSGVQDALNRLFESLIRENAMNERIMKEFQERCGR